MAIASWKATEGETPQIESNVYDAVFEGVSEGPEGQFGPSLKWQFGIIVDGEPETVTGLTSTSGSVKGKAFQFFTGILGRQPEVGEEIEPASLVGKRCRVLVEDNSKGWPTVTKVTPAKAK